MTIDKKILYTLLTESAIDEWEVVEDKITSSDPEDGGADHCAIFKNTQTNKFYRCFYCDWDIEYNNDDLNPNLKEVEPYQELVTKYKIKE